MEEEGVGGQDAGWKGIVGTRSEWCVAGTGVACTQKMAEGVGTQEENSSLRSTGILEEHGDNI